MTELLAVIIITVAFLGQSTFGFGGGLVAVPLLSVLIGVKDGVTLALVFQLLMGFLLYRTHREIAWRRVRPLLAAMMIGTVLGTCSLSIAPERWLRPLLGGFTLLFLAKSLLLSDVLPERMKRNSWAAGTGLAAGWIQGAVGTGGPLFVMYLGATIREKAALRATLILVLFLSNLLRLFVSLPAGLLRGKTAGMVIITLPFFLAAVLVGERLHLHMTERHYRFGVNVILLFSALALILRG